MTDSNSPMAELMVMTRAITSGEESISSYFLSSLPIFFYCMVLIAAFKAVLPWSTCPMVPTFTCGFVRSNFSLAISKYPSNLHKNDAAHHNQHPDYRFIKYRRTASNGDHPKPGAHGQD